MKTLLQTVAVAFSMFSSLPVPQFPWTERNMRWMLAAFPLVGGVAGGACWAWAALCGALTLPAVLRGAGLCLLPVLVTGGIHLDGYADTCDALASCASPEKKQEILKDPRCGAFAVIRLCAYFTAYFALCASAELSGRALGCMTLAFVLERALSGLAIARFPLAKNTGLAHTFATAADRKTVGRILLAVCALAGGGLIALGGLAGGAMLAAALWTFQRYDVTARRQFGGISGDLAGWFLQRAELGMLAALVFTHLIIGRFS